MQSSAKTPDDYTRLLPEDRRVPIARLREVISKNLPTGFKEGMAYGMIGYMVPHELYPAGYHCDPKQALPFLSIASQKNFIAVYHMGIYADPILLDWFVSGFSKHSKGKPDMGKSCIRFKKPEQIPFALIGELASKMTVNEWITLYESALLSKR
jgi:uncharacterized protein DUF1801